MVLVCLLASGAAAQALLTWTASTNALTQGYVVFHGTQSGAYSDLWSVGNVTNATVSRLPYGANYFAVSDWGMTNGVLWMSQWSSEVVATNTATALLTSVILTSTNLNGRWLPFNTNRLVFGVQPGNQFFRAGGLTLVISNVITVPN